MAVGDEILIIDPLIPGMTEALAPWLADTSILKIMHSASEDLVTFKVACGVLPRPLFDTQIGASLLPRLAGRAHPGDRTGARRGAPDCAGVRDFG